jgi:hypothetical protein
VNKVNESSSIKLASSRRGRQAHALKHNSCNDGHHSDSPRQNEGLTSWMGSNWEPGKKGVSLVDAAIITMFGS